MNGALFAAWRVLFNNMRMAGLSGETAHPIYVVRNDEKVVFTDFFHAFLLCQLGILTFNCGTILCNNQNFLRASVCSIGRRVYW